MALAPRPPYESKSARLGNALPEQDVHIATFPYCRCVGDFGSHARACRIASAISWRVIFLAIKSRSLRAPACEAAAARLSHM